MYRTIYFWIGIALALQRIDIFFHIPTHTNTYQKSLVGKVNIELLNSLDTSLLIGELKEVLSSASIPVNLPCGEMTWKHYGPKRALQLCFFCITHPLPPISKETCFMAQLERL